MRTVIIFRLCTFHPLFFPPLMFQRRDNVSYKNSDSFCFLKSYYVSVTLLNVLISPSHYNLTTLLNVLISLSHYILTTSL